MAPSLKLIGLVALTALALVAAFAPAAQAEEAVTFTSGDTDAGEPHTASQLHATQYGSASQNFFELVPSSEERITCESATFELTEDDAEADGTAASLVAAPAYTHCTASGLPATIAPNGCTYTLAQPEPIAAGEFTGAASLRCPEGKAIEVTVFLFGGATSHSVDVCTIKAFPASGESQQLGGHVIYRNQTAEPTEGTSKDDITANAALEGISWEQEGSCESASGSEAIYRNTQTIAGQGEGEEHHDVWLEGEGEAITFTSGDTDAGEPHTASQLHATQYGSASQNFFELVPSSEERITCESATFELTEDDAEADGTAASLVAAPAYTHCTANGLPATIAPNGCTYTLAQPEPIAAGEFTGAASLRCPEGKAIEVTVFLFGGATSHSTDVCTVKAFPASGESQQLGGHVIYRNQTAEPTEGTSKDDITASAALEGISWEKEGSCGEESGSEAIYRSTLTIAGQGEGEEHHDVWLEGGGITELFTAGATPETHTASTVTAAQYGPTSENYFEIIPGSEESFSCESTFQITDDDPKADGTAAALIANPTYTHCLINGLPTTVASNGCSYTLGPVDKIAADEYTGNVRLHCPSGNAIELTTFLFGSVTSHSQAFCKLKFSPAGESTEETLGGHVIYSNQTVEVEGGDTRDDITANITLEGISWEQEGSCGEESGSEAIYRNTLTITASDQELGEPHDIWISEAA